MKEEIGSHLYYRHDVWDLFLNDPNLNDTYILDYTDIEYMAYSFKHEMNKYKQIYQIVDIKLNIK